MVFLQKNGIEMGIIGIIKHQMESFYRHRIVCEQYPMLTSLSRKKWGYKGASGLVYMLHHVTDKDPNGIPNNLCPYITQVAIGKLPYLNVFGNDYNTHDGTGVRDYIHVVDLAKGHVKALEKIDKEGQGLYIYNLGTGTGYSVLDMINAFEKSTGRKVNYKITARRAGDIAVCYADPKKAKEELGWVAEKNLEDMCKDSWNYIEKNQ